MSKHEYRLIIEMDGNTSLTIVLVVLIIGLASC